MTVNRKHSKKDGNHKQMHDELVALGFDVDDVHYIPGLYDMLVSHGREAVRVEVKQLKEHLTMTEKLYYARQQHPTNYLIAYSTDDVLRWFGRL